jgi:predicted phage tail protein
MIRKVHLMGNLGKQFGEEWSVNCTTVSECLRLIECQATNFRKYLIEIVEQGTNFSVRTGEELIGTGEELFMNVNAEDIYITEIPAGSGGWGKILVGALLITAAIFVPYLPVFLSTVTTTTIGAGGLATATVTLGTTGAGAFAAMALGSIGLNLIMAGVNELLMPKPDKGKAGGAIFSGPVNNVKQGQPVPLLYGELIVGGSPISSTFTKAKINSTGVAYSSASSIPGATPTYTGGSPTPFVSEGSFNSPMEVLPLLRITPEGV